MEELLSLPFISEFVFRSPKKLDPTEKEVADVAGFFGLRYETDPQAKEQFNHSLRTAVIAPDGKVTKIFSGNEWTKNDLFRELQATLK